MRHRLAWFGIAALSAACVAAFALPHVWAAAEEKTTAAVFQGKPLAYWSEQALASQRQEGVETIVQALSLALANRRSQGQSDGPGCPAVARPAGPSGGAGRGARAGRIAGLDRRRRDGRIDGNRQGCGPDPHRDFRARSGRRSHASLAGPGQSRPGCQGRAAGLTESRGQRCGTAARTAGEHHRPDPRRGQGSPPCGRRWRRSPPARPQDCRRQTAAIGPSSAGLGGMRSAPKQAC